MTSPDGTVALETTALFEAAGRVASTSGEAEDALNRHGPAIQALTAEALAADDEYAAQIRKWHDQPAESIQKAVPVLTQNFATLGQNVRTSTDEFHGVDQSFGGQRQ